MRELRRERRKMPRPGYQRTADTLNDEGRPTRQGGRWYVVERQTSLQLDLQERPAVDGLRHEVCHRMKAPCDRLARAPRVKARELRELVRSFNFERRWCRMGAAMRPKALTVACGVVATLSMAMAVVLASLLLRPAPDLPPEANANLVLTDSRVTVWRGKVH